jgi:TolB-like protein/DNA-binding winged helix-turn-helix (wHTH) protein/Tfp pilus assembly protein PilF
MLRRVRILHRSIARRYVPVPARHEVIDFRPVWVILMSSSLESPDLAWFGPFRVDFRAGELVKNGRKVRLQEQPLQVLALLIERAGEVVAREQLRQKLWPNDTFVDFNHGLNNAINRLREALNDSAEEPRFIETLPRRGYRFVAKVQGDENRGTHIDPLKDPLETGKIINAEEPTASEKASPIQPIRRVRKVWFAAAGVGIAAALIFGLYFGREGRLHANAAMRIRSVAVLPLENLSSDSSQEYFADGMTDELITDLASIASLRVISRTSTAHYKGTRKTLPEIARELNVDAVVEGSVTRTANKVRIRAQLIRATPEEHLWAESYERDLVDVLALQRDVATAIADKIKVTLTPAEKARLAKPRPINPDAYNAYLLGVYHANKRNSAEMNKGIEYFHEAVRIDPNYAQAFAGLAFAYIERDVWGRAALGESANQVRANTLRALELDGNLAEAHALLGRIHFQYDWDWPGTETEYKRAIELNPNLTSSYWQYAYFLQTMGRQQEAIATVHRAVELDPLSAAIICDEGRILYRARQYEASVARYQRALELDPGYLPAIGRIADAYEQLGKYDEALNYIEKWQQAAGDRHTALGPLARIYARMGKRREAVDILRILEKDGLPGEDYWLAGIYSALGDRDRGIVALERGIQTRSMLPIVIMDPNLDPLRSDPRFQQVWRRVGLGQ